MNDHIKEYLKDIDFKKEDFGEIDHLIFEIYNSEMNFNNADPTSGQRCWSWSDIERDVLEYLEEQ